MWGEVFFKGRGNDKLGVRLRRGDCMDMFKWVFRFWSMRLLNIYM